jgi:aryl-alcohol dehydrogenase-like predicted oxidoreductase
MTLETTQLGSSGIEVTRICLGCWQMGISEWSDVEDEASIATIHRALDLGINFLDSAEVYGRGHSEEVVGKALKGRREQVVIGTKVGHRNLRRDAVRSALEGSLGRLQTDYVDLYQIHWPWREVPPEETLEAMTELKQEGKIRAIGVSNFGMDVLSRSVQAAKIDSLQPPFSIVWREIDDEVLPFCTEHNVAVLAYSPMAQGLILGKFKSKDDLPDDCRGRNVLTRDGIWEKVLAVSDVVAAMGEKYGKSPAQVALNWVLATPGITCAIAGSRRPEHIADSVGALGWEMDSDDYDGLSELGWEAFAPIPPGETLWHWKPDGFDD